MWSLTPISLAAPRKYYNVSGCGIIMVVYTGVEEDTQYHTLVNQSFIFWVEHSIYTDAKGKRKRSTKIIIIPRLFQNIVVPQDRDIEDITPDGFRERYQVSLKYKHWYKHPDDKLPLARIAYGMCYDELTSVVSYTHSQATNIAKIRPAGIVITDPSFYGDYKIPHMIGDEYEECHTCKDDFICNEKLAAIRDPLNDGQWICVRDRETGKINNNDLYDTNGEYADEYYEPTAAAFREKMREIATRTAYVYVEVAMGSSYYILKITRYDRIVVAIKEFANVDTTKYVKHIAAKGKDYLYLGGVRDWLNDRKKGTKLFDAVFADLIGNRTGPKKRATLLCDVDIIFTE